jgi:hypothetical protein
MFRDEIKSKLREKIHEFLQNDEDLEKIPIDSIKQVGLKNKSCTMVLIKMFIDNTWICNAI